MSLDKAAFSEINVKEDMQKNSYRSMHEMLNNVKKAARVKYLYTAKKNESSEFIYLIDGLDYDSQDFRYPGDPIEWEIYDDMERALTGGPVLPKAIKNTGWGKIFITYMPQVS